MIDSPYFAFLLLACCAFTSYYFKKLDALGATSGLAIAWGIYIGGGYASVWLLLLFFVLGTVASKWKEREKAKINLAQSQEGIRSWGNAWGNAGVAALAGYALYAYPEYRDYLLPLLSGSLAGATADTLSSELGNIYGRKYIDVLSWKKGEKGEDGVVSLEGTLFGIGGGLVIALFCMEYFVAVWIGGVMGTVIDSVLGATLERRGLLGNNAVNFISTLLAGLIAAAIII